MFNRIYQQILMRREYAIVYITNIKTIILLYQIFFNNLLTVTKAAAKVNAFGLLKIILIFFGNYANFFVEIHCGYGTNNDDTL